ncbi:hypothetical protein X943_000892 [Babesia divergens]|uniref:RING-type domain-containing protein n=1 Tax=Babesia divergens TaxID=32595 RepID=A0AAD9G8U9_BABDI|nr:hypothetical protein X943_000892 [Babesia divergens]
MNNECGTRQSPNMQNMGTSDAGEICGAPPQDSGDMEHQTTGHADTDAQHDGNAYNRIHQSNNLQRDAYGNQEEGSESDCEIIGVVPNRHGEVMNHRVVPGVDRAPIVELYDRLCGLAALTNGFMVNNPQTSSDGTQHGGSSYPHTSNTQNNGRSLPQNRGGYEYALFDDRNRDTYPGRSNNGQNTRQSRNVDTNAGLQNTDGDDDVIVGPMFWGPPRPPVSSREYYAKPKPVVSAYNYIESDGRMAEATNVLDDVEFLFRCPICYSTIARFKSGKVPNNNDRVIYSTKCGHMYCFECIEGVRKRRECSICRKPLKDSKQYHVVYP